MKKIFIFLISLSLSGNAKAALIPLKKEPTSNYATKNTFSTFSTKADTPPREKKSKNKKIKKNDTDPERLKRLHKAALTAATINAVFFNVFLTACIVMIIAVFALRLYVGILALIFGVAAFIFMITWIITSIISRTFKRKYMEASGGDSEIKSNEKVVTPAKQDVVYLKNGSIIKGNLLETIPGVSIKIELLGGSVMVYKMEDVEKIVKE